MRDSGPGSQPVHSPHAIPEQAHLPSSVVALDPICRHPGCTDATVNGRSHYCAEHSQRRYHVERWRLRRAERRKLGLPPGWGICEDCGERYERSGRQQKYCLAHRRTGKSGRAPRRPGVIYCPPGLDYETFAASIPVSMSTYARRRREGWTHERAAGCALPNFTPPPKQHLYPLTREQQIANQWLRTAL